MSYTNVYPSRINWENEPSIASPINATNLNKIDYAVYEHDQTFGTWDVTKANQSDLLLSVKSIDYDDETGVFVFTWQNGTTKTVDLNIEKIPVSFSMSPLGVITMTTEDGTTYTADVGALIKTYTFTDSARIDFTVTTDLSGNKTVTADIVNGSITGNKLQPDYLADCTAAKTGAETAADKAEDNSEDSEAWAVGTRDGVPVPSSDPAYENNSKYWAQHTTSSFAGLSDTDISSPQDGQVPVYNSTTQKWENADQSAGGGSKITVTTTETTLKGKNVTLTQGQTTLTATFDNSGVAVFEGVTLTGTVELVASDGTSTSRRTQTIPYFGNYDVTMTFFSATITVTYPSGASCTISDGTTTLTAISNPMAFDIPNAGTWTAKATLDGVEKSGTAISITTDGQTASDTIAFGTINLTLDSDFIGSTITCVKDQTTISKVASGTSLTFYPPTTGDWTISGSVGGTTYVSNPNPVSVSSLSTPVSASLQTMPIVTVTLYSATEDLVTVVDEDGTHTEQFANGQSSKSVQIKIMASGSSVTFTSSVAKNPDNLSAYYTKTVTITNSTTEVYVMPDNVMYWYGNEVNCEDKTPANGWRLDQTFTNPTRNTNSISFVTSDVNHMSAIGAKYSVGDFTTINVLVMNSSGSYKQLDSNLVKDFVDAQVDRYNYSNISTLTKVLFTPTNIKSGFPSTGTQTGTLQICAFWVE